jgi:hypothetical protein
VEAFAKGMLVAAGRLGWRSGGWSGDGRGWHDSAVDVGEDQPVGVVGVAGDPEATLVVETVVSRT